METSKLISILIAKLKIAYPYYFKDLTDEQFIGLISMYQEELSGYTETTLNMAIKSIIRNHKFMPSLNELIDECNNCSSSRGNAILDLMREDGYFKRSAVGELSDEQATRNYEKSLSFVARGIIPDWLLEDMKSYGYEEDKILLTNSSIEDKKEALPYDNSRIIQIPQY